MNILYVMQTKLTLRMDDLHIRQAKEQAAKRGKSVSQMFVEFVSTMEADKHDRRLPPVTRGLRGLLKDREVSPEDYKRHLEEKYL